MPTENEIRVMKLLTAIEIPPDAADRVQSWGNEAVTVVVEAALGAYPGLRQKVRTNAVALLGGMTHPQAAEAVAMLIRDPNPDIAIRAMRAAGEQRNEEVVESLGEVLADPAATALLAAEAVKSLEAIGSARARASLDNYLQADPGRLHHRASRVVQDVIQRRRSG
ncbi:MAG: HEAT repeat domain-containing protein [Pseudomonadota bacterium]